MTNDIRKIFEYENLEINASERLNTLNILVDGKPYLLSEMGSGFAQFVISLGNAAIQDPSWILLDEPELNLHPTLQMDFMTALGSYASRGVIFATHSIGLSRAVADRIYSFRLDDRGCSVRPFEATQNYAEFIGEMSFSSYMDMGYDRILLVEGVHDVKTVQQFLRMLKKDHQTVILPLGGDQLARGGVEAEISEITRLSSNVFALVDSERTSKKGKPIAVRVAFEKTCKKLGIDVCLTQRTAIENYFVQDAIKAVLGEEYIPLGPYERLQDAPKKWRKSLNWRIARHMTFDDIRDTDVGEFLSKL